MKDKYYINEKTYLATEKNFALHHCLKVNKPGGGGGREKIEKLISVPPVIRHLRVCYKTGNTHSCMPHYTLID